MPLRGASHAVPVSGDRKWRARHDYLKIFDVVLFAGGGNLNSHFTELIARRVAIAAACKAARVPYVISGQGIGPVAPEIAPMLAFLASEADAVATRDPLSASSYDKSHPARRELKW